MRYFFKSAPLTYSETNIEPINVIYQYFIHNNPARQREIDICLQKNIDNPLITKIYLLNEKIYQLPTSRKIVQIDVGKRLTFKMVFDFIENNNLTGYNVIINSDIFFDDTIMRLYQSDIHKTKAAFALLRWEYDPARVPTIFGPTWTSQDTWIIHSSANIERKHRDVFDFYFGVGQCDNKMIYLLYILGYKIYNSPNFIKTLHYHSSQIRSWSSQSYVPHPTAFITPLEYNLQNDFNYPYAKSASNDMTYGTVCDNTRLHEYLTSHRGPFIIPRVGKNKEFLETARIGRQLIECKVFDAAHDKLIDKLPRPFDAKVVAALAATKLFIKWPDICVEDTDNRRDGIWSTVLEVFHYINIELPWTHAFAGKRLLIISEFADLINEQARKRLYTTAKYPIFPESCHITATASFDARERERDFDVALCAMGEQGNEICARIYACGKSAINVGNILLLYFGIVPGQFGRIFRDIISLYADDQWKLLPSANVPNDSVIRY